MLPAPDTNPKHFGFLPELRPDRAAIRFYTTFSSGSGSVDPWLFYQQLFPLQCDLKGGRLTCQLWHRMAVLLRERATSFAELAPPTSELWPCLNSNRLFNVEKMQF